MSKIDKELPKGLRLKKVPQDVMKFILLKQKEIKNKKKVLVYSQELTIYQIIREVMSR